jgi:hypothetical protein
VKGSHHSWNVGCSTRTTRVASSTEAQADAREEVAVLRLGLDGDAVAASGSDVHRAFTPLTG